MSIRKEELRPCIVRSGEIAETVRNAMGERHIDVIKKAEAYEGYFHTWGSEQYVTNSYIVGTIPGQVSFLYGIVEYKDGSIHKVDPECIIFTDRDCTD